MSSEESVGTNSTRLRQFGLYRNIDERTEEFLKLSRKRQIRQGCACAAVSTAITVTIVVSILIVFEYGFHSDPEPALQPKHNPNWFSMLNDSEVKFDFKQQHANIKSTVLLPLLLKALKQNRILEKAIEEYSSNTPNYEDATDYPLERNVFTDARNWLRMPPPRMYAFEYKTSPIVFFKSRNIDEFYRARKVMDSRRVMNYLNRMMNDKAAYVTTGTNNVETDNTVKKMSSTATPKRATTHFARLEERKKSTAKKDTATTIKELHFNDCKCPSNVRDVLEKLLLGVQMLFSLRNENVQPEAQSEDCDSKTSNPNLQAKTFVASRRTITPKRPPKVTSTHSSLPINLFKSIIKSKASSTTKLSKILRTIQSTTEKIDLSSLLNSEMTRKQNDANDNASSTTKLSEKLGRTIQSTTEKIDLDSLLNTETTRKENDENDNDNETTTFKPYLAVPYYTSTITTTKPMTPATSVTTEDDTRVRTTEHFIRKSQNDPVYSPQYLNYEVNDVQLNPTTLIPSKMTCEEVLSNEETEENKKKTLSNFLFKYKESKKNNNKFEDNRIEMLDDHLVDSDTMRTFNSKNELVKGNFKVRSNIKITKDRTKVNDLAFLKSKSKIAATKDEFGAVIRDLTAWNTVPYNITYGSIRLPNDSNEKPISALPQLSPSFLQIRRNERQEENDYYANTKF